MNSVANAKDRYLDLIFCSTADGLNVAVSESPLVKEDYPHHRAMECHVEITSELHRSDVSGREEMKYCYDFRKADTRKLNEYFKEIDFATAFSSCRNVDEMVLFLYYMMYIGFEWFVPKKVKRNYQHPPWYNRSLIRLKNKKDRMFRKYCSSARCPLLFRSYKFFSKKVCELPVIFVQGVLAEHGKKFCH